MVLFGMLFTITGCDSGGGNDAKFGSLGCYAPLQDAISGVGKDAQWSSLGRYSPLQDAISGVRNDAKCRSLGCYSPLQGTISGSVNDAKWGSLGRYSTLQDAISGVGNWLDIEMPQAWPYPTVPIGTHRYPSVHRTDGYRWVPMGMQGTDGYAGYALASFRTPEIASCNGE